MTETSTLTLRCQEYVRPTVKKLHYHKLNCQGRDTSALLSPFYILFDEIVGSLQYRFAEGQEARLKGAMLFPAYTAAKQDWESFVQTFALFYCDEIPSSQTIHRCRC